ncbi:MAG TPA: hypothetical protein VHE53_01365 [Patescibacteria group bacterium]|nr:hypothetical protein [Patescibacteria group bacterium]
MNLRKVKLDRLKKVAILSFIAGLIVATLIWFPRIDFYKKSLSYQTDTNKAVEEQLEILRKESRIGLTPTPSPIRFVKNQMTNLSKIECYDPSKDKVAPDWNKSITSNLDKKEKLVYACYNDSIKQIAFITSKDVSIVKSSKAYENDLKLIRLPDKRATDIFISSGGALGESCQKISGWTKYGIISFVCGSGDGVVSTTTTYQYVSNYSINVDKIEQCFVHNDSKYCTHFCESSDECQSGSFCNLATNSCVLLCIDNAGSCAFGSCSPAGPYLACNTPSN